MPLRGCWLDQGLLLVLPVDPLTRLEVLWLSFVQTMLLLSNNSMDMVACTERDSWCLPIDLVVVLISVCAEKCCAAVEGVLRYSHVCAASKLPEQKAGTRKPRGLRTMWGWDSRQKDNLGSKVSHSEMRCSFLARAQRMYESGSICK